MSWLRKSEVDERTFESGCSVSSIMRIMSSTLWKPTKLSRRIARLGRVKLVGWKDVSKSLEYIALNWIWGRVGHWYTEAFCTSEITGNSFFLLPVPNTSCWTCLELKSTIFWGITLYNPLKVNRRFGGTYRLHLQGRKISRGKNQPISACHLLSRWCLARLILRPLRWRQYVLPKRRLIFNGLYGVIPQKIILFITTAVRTWNPTCIEFHTIISKEKRHLFD
jgi:hypothetical protein